MMMMMMMHGDLSFHREGERLASDIRSRDLYGLGVRTYTSVLKELLPKWLQLGDFRTLKLTISRTHMLSIESLTKIPPINHIRSLQRLPYFGIPKANHAVNLCHQRPLANIPKPITSSYHRTPSSYGADNHTSPFRSCRSNTRPPPPPSWPPHQSP